MSTTSTDTVHPLDDDPYTGYTYAYPHKTAYRTLDPPVPLSDLWAQERREGLFLYIHVPYCEMRCGFCNLFTVTGGRPDAVAAWLQALRREASVVSTALGKRSFARLAIGGGTPTVLAPEQLEAVLELARDLGANSASVPASVELSPATATDERLAVLAERGVDRVSLGVQSFDDAEAREMGRPQRLAVVEAALERIRSRGFPNVNIDLIYGAPNQTERGWLESIDTAVAHRPAELYLYPLYVRPLTGLARVGRRPDAAQRLALYRAGRDRLLGAGWTQVSMRMFRAPWSPRSAVNAPDYRCQEDGMVGLGPGARSYTRALHYSTEYAVRRSGVQAILADYSARGAEEFAYARHGVRLDERERRRRYVIQSLLQVDGLDRADYQRVFGRDVLETAEQPQLLELVRRGLAEVGDERIRLTPAGLERSDAIGPWLMSAAMRSRMGSYRWR